MQSILIIGGKGNGTVIASAIMDAKCRVEGFLSDTKESEICGLPVMGAVKDAPLFPHHGMVYALATVKKAEERFDRFLRLNLKNEFPTICHPTSSVGRWVTLADGVILMPHAVISPGATIGRYCQLYANSFVGHDSVLGEAVFVANNASIGGDVIVGMGAHIGSNSTVREHVTIGDWAIVGMGSVVLHDVEPRAIVAGNPARKIGEV